ncbi:MAG: TonB-dependent receptor [Pseudomonadota bacterium]
MRNKMRLSSRLLFGAGLSAIAATSVYAQDEIVVTATKREQTLQEVPIAVSVVDAQTIQDAQIIDIIDLQASVPSLRVTQQQNASQTNFLIRGFGNGANNPGIEPSVGVFIDGVYRSRSAAAILDLPDLERVEVLRGPQSTLFGKNVSVGAISITTKLPTFEWEGSAELTAGNFNTRRFRGTVAGPITDTLAFRVSGSTNNRDGTYTNIFNGSENLNERDRWAARAQLLWEPTETFRARLIGDYNQIDEVCCGTVQLLTGPVTEQVIGLGLGGVIPPDDNPGDRIAALDQDPVNELRGRGASLQADWDVGFGVITSITSYREQSDFNNTDVDFTSVDLATQPQQVDYETFTQEIRIAGEFDSGIGTFNWLAGGFLFNEEVNFFQQTTFGSDFREFGNIQLGALGTSFETLEEASSLVNTLVDTDGLLGVPFFPEFNPVGGADVLPLGSSFADQTGFTGDFELENRSFSAFFQTDWEITDRLTLTAGVSYIRDRKKAIGNVVQTDPFQNIDLSQFALSGQSLNAAGILAADRLASVGTPEEGLAQVLTDPVPLAVNLLIDQAVDPAGFEASRSAAVAEAQAQFAANPLSNPIFPFSTPAFQALQFIPMQTPFPDPNAIRDNDITTADDGFAIDDDINVTARLAYDVTDSLNAYFSYATGYKAPAVNLSQDSAIPQVGTNGLAVGRFADAEEVTVFELGFKAQFDGGFLNVALFDQTVENFQSNAFTGTGFVFANAGQQSVRGFEVEAAYSPVEAMNINFGLTYLDPNYDEFVAAPCPSAGNRAIVRDEFLALCDQPGVSTVDLTDERPAGIHPVSLSTAVSYRFDLPGNATLTPRVEYLLDSEVALIDGANDDAPTREVSQFNANIAYVMENGFSVNVFGRNLNNNAGLITFFPSVAQAGSFSGYVVQPRTWGVSIRKDF